MPRLHVNEIGMINSHPLRSIIRVRQGGNFGMPSPITHFRHVSLAQYEADKRVPPPAPNGRRIVVADEPRDVPPPDDEPPHDVHTPGRRPKR